MRAAIILPASAALLLLAGCATQSPPSEAAVLPARVFDLKGAARWRSAADQPWQEAKTGTRLLPGAEIQTAADSRADICFGKSPKRTKSVLVARHSGRIVGHKTVYENMIRLWENSFARFDRLVLAGTEDGTRRAEAVRIELSAGHVFGMVPKLAEGSRYEIKFLAGVARIRGTVYAVSAEGHIKVLSGSVSVTYLGSQKPQVVTGLQEFDVRTGVLSQLPDCD